MECAVKLKNLLKDLSIVVKGSKETAITGISSDSRTLAPGNLFIAKKGSSYDGSEFIGQALRAGASAVVTDIYDPFLKIVQIIHSNPQEIEALLAARYYNYPSKELSVIGVTGTKGKTTTTYLVKHFFDFANKSCGLIGTVETIMGEHRHFSTLTTQDAISNQRYLREMVLKGCKAVALEVSSHGLSQGRVDEIAFDVGIFTNLYADHLDYHKTVDAYALAKKELFRKAKLSILNADSPWSEKMGFGFSYGIENGDLKPDRIQFFPDKTVLEIQGVVFESPLIGRFNVYNLLAAVSAGVKMGLSLEEMSSSLACFQGAPGRMQRVDNVFVDFAHTGESLENALKTLREITKGKLIVVFGCGGNRDPGRRAAMAASASQWADVSIITNDNPRNEDPEEIARQIANGFSKASYYVELDRRKAIEMAIAMAASQDTVLIAGKGHEKTQILSTKTIPFDDVAVAKEVLLLK
jgi:UDP-N-acetylmuramoyl-L-alanyl-D-glutamate--2,6-diaminopimelate ligase